MKNIYDQYLWTKEEVCRLKDCIKRIAIKSHNNCAKNSLTTMQQIEHIEKLIKKKESMELFIAVVEDWLRDNPEYADTIQIKALAPKERERVIKNNLKMSERTFFRRYEKALRALEITIKKFNDNQSIL